MNEYKEDKLGKWFNDHIERHMFRTKYIISIAILASLTVSIALIGYGFYEVWHLMIAIFNQNVKEIQLLALNIVDMFLFGMVMMIFAFGSYNLFISKIDNVDRNSETHEIRPRWVRVESFGELKTIIIRVIVMILSITFLELVISNLELFKENVYVFLVIPIGILLIALSSYLMHKTDDLTNNKETMQQKE